MNTIAEQWALFESGVLPRGCPPVQRQEMRRAFYAGAEAMLRLGYSVGDKSISENAGVAMFEGWHDECRRFAQQVAQGQA